ncbi:MAG: hypothetical protein DRI57_04880 [Deltaproteobacteria bacterium]|nr:MAG: hypothetical protein DRI57_04880 [Deltaproteobacteria bacterium]
MVRFSTIPAPLFEGTQPFNEKITRLTEQLEHAIKTDDEKERERIKAELKALNPDYFSYFDMDRLLEKIAGEGSE